MINSGKAVDHFPKDVHTFLNCILYPCYRFPTTADFASTKVNKFGLTNKMGGPGSSSFHSASGLGGLHNNGSSSSGSGLLPETLIWTYVMQLTSALRHIHTAGLACRTLDPTKILVINKTRYRPYPQKSGECSSSKVTFLFYLLVQIMLLPILPDFC